MAKSVISFDRRGDIRFFQNHLIHDIDVGQTVAVAILRDRSRINWREFKKNPETSISEFKSSSFIRSKKSAYILIQ